MSSAVLAALADEFRDRVFGAVPIDPVEAIAFRDAELRANHLRDCGEALIEFDSADRYGDDQLAAAIARRAFNEGWLPVLVAYTTVRPDVLGSLWQLAKAVRGEGT